MPSLRNQAWNTFSKWIRARDGHCVTCPNGGAEQAGHFFHGVLDFDEENINAQCLSCNHYKSGNLAIYSVYLLKKLGKKKFDALNIRHYRAMAGEKRYPQDFKDLIDKYTLKE